jgi:hypothetical protein
LDMTGVVATLLAVGIIAALMVLGIRMKLPPPDPDWREHPPPPFPPRSRFWQMLWLGRFPLLLAMILVAAFRLNDRILMALGLSYVAVIVAVSAERVVLAFRLRRARRPSS